MTPPAPHSKGLPPLSKRRPCTMNPVHVLVRWHPGIRCNSDAFDTWSNSVWWLFVNTRSITHDMPHMFACSAKFRTNATYLWRPAAEPPSPTSVYRITRVYISCHMLCFTRCFTRCQYVLCPMLCYTWARDGNTMGAKSSLPCGSPPASTLKTQ